jgi:glycosyltransferase involved in cell wall biosynthesis
MHRILFIDPFCPKTYDGVTLLTVPQGGTESTVTRLAEALASKGCVVRVTQHNREEKGTHNGVEYTPFKQNDDFNPTHIIAMRDARMLNTSSKQWPRAKNYVWYHDMFQPGNAFSEQAEALIANQAIAITVSEWHRDEFYMNARANGYGGRVVARRIYNPIGDLKPDATPVDENKFLFFSSPHKGLADTVKLFERFQDFPELKDVKLYVANPGYYANEVNLAARNIIDLGPLAWPEVIKHLRSAFLVLHINKVFPETFGLVHAESNAVGTPWISGYLGANREVADHPYELTDLNDPKSVIDRIILWKDKGRIKVRGSSLFKIEKILIEWKDVLSR